ncbi:hypothetical protein [Nocardioides sp.]|uniref:hypothetical protein n=1 Tax=Nocardioides sp. TaxID=35761 RepID=UPI0035651C5F
MGTHTIVDEGEARRWFAEGRTHAWMQAEYLRKYGLQTTLSAWSDYGCRNGLERRDDPTGDPNDVLVPWEIDKRHRWAYALMMLRTEARRRSGIAPTETMAERLERWLRQMSDDNTVVAYNPNSEDGFTYVPRRSGIDTDLIRQPDAKATLRLVPNQSAREDLSSGRTRGGGAPRA